LTAGGSQRRLTALALVSCALVFVWALTSGSSGAVAAASIEHGLTQNQTLSPTDAGGGYGRSIAMDNTTMVVGADSDLNGTADKYGAAFVYSLTGPGKWVTPQKLIGPDTDGSTDAFGTAVAGASGTQPDGESFVYDAPTNGDIATATQAAEFAVEAFDYPAPGYGASIAIDGSTLLVGGQAPARAMTRTFTRRCTRRGRTWASPRFRP